ncbi:hypothetical protein TcWFU_007406 [Taenia crassiceps]|uniref:Uncharacterized protein n=1 Tax=Taenia crassiceps TaxID=6207 RepID=A0ABR4QET2_9CEST
MVNGYDSLQVKMPACGSTKIRSRDKAVLDKTVPSSSQSGAIEAPHFRDLQLSTSRWCSLSSYQRSFRSTDWLRLKKRVPTIQKYIEELRKALYSFYRELNKAEMTLAKHRMPQLDPIILPAVESSAVLQRLCNDLRLTSLEKEVFGAYRGFANFVNEAFGNSEMVLLKLPDMAKCICEIEDILEEDLLPDGFQALAGRILYHVMEIHRIFRSVWVERLQDLLRRQFEISDTH